MQTDLHDFLVRLLRTIAITLLPVALVTFATLPSSLHHHIGKPDRAEPAVAQHMT